MKLSTTPGVHTTWGPQDHVIKFHENEDKTDHHTDKNPTDDGWI